MTVTAQIIIIVMQIITVAAGIAFLIYARGKNIVYNKALVFLGIGSSLLLLWVMFDVPLDRIASDPIVPWMISFCGPVLALGPIGIAVKFEEDYFDERFFIWKRRHFYKDVTGYKIEKHKSIKGPDLDELVLYFGKVKVSIYIGPNYQKLLENIKREYRKNHDGKEIPDISKFPGYTESLDANKKKKEPNPNLAESVYLRAADTETKERVLLSVEFEGHDIVYRRVGRTNELVIDGYVYDEYIKLMEFSHELSANVGGYNITAGFDSKASESYIAVDGIFIERKTRFY